MIKKNDLVSIIIPFYNGSKFVRTCVESLKKQTYSNFEAIFVDDGSTDDASEKIKQYQDERFTVLRQDKAGVSAARNLGIRNAQGKYLAFMDIDDEVEKDFLLSQVMAADTHHAEMVLCDYVKVYPNGKEEKHILPWGNCLLTKDQISDQLIPWSIWRKDGPIMGSACRCLILRSFWDRNHVFFYENVTIAEDLLFLLALYNRTDRIYVNSECLYRYNIHPNSTLNSFRPERLEQRLLFHKVLYNTLEEKGIYEKNISQYRSNKASMYTVELSNCSRNPELFKSRPLLKKLREELMKEPFDWRTCDISFGRMVSLWMLEYRLYSLLLILYRVKEWMRLRK